MAPEASGLGPCLGLHHHRGQLGLDAARPKRLNLDQFGCQVARQHASEAGSHVQRLAHMAARPEIHLPPETEALCSRRHLFRGRAWQLRTTWRETTRKS